MKASWDLSERCVLKKTAVGRCEGDWVLSLVVENEVSLATFVYALAEMVSGLPRQDCVMGFPWDSSDEKQVLPHMAILARSTGWHLQEGHHRTHRIQPRAHERTCGCTAEKVFAEMWASTISKAASQDEVRLRSS
jgi:hypothetical protein